MLASNRAAALVSRELSLRVADEAVSPNVLLSLRADQARRTASKSEFWLTGKAVEAKRCQQWPPHWLYDDAIGSKMHAVQILLQHQAYKHAPRQCNNNA